MQQELSAGSDAAKTLYAFALALGDDDLFPKV
jgi:hypothetical protein